MIEDDRGMSHCILPDKPGQVVLVVMLVRV